MSKALRRLSKTSKNAYLSTRNEPSYTQKKNNLIRLPKLIKPYPFALLLNKNAKGL